MKQTEKAKQAGMSRPTPNNDDEKVPTTPLRESHALEDEELVKRTQDLLDDMNGREHTSIRTTVKNPARDFEEYDDDEDDEEVVDDDEQSVEDDDDESSEKDGDDDSDDEDSIVDPDTEHSSDTNDSDGTSGLPDAFVRSAVAYGWGTKEEAIEYYKEDPQRALNVFKQIYNARLNATSEYARLGHEARLQQTKKENDAKPTVKKLTPDQIAKLKSELGDEVSPLLDIIQTQQDVLEQLVPANKELVTSSSTGVEPPMGLAEQGAIDQQINQFFASDGMKPWRKVYGTIAFGQDWEDLSPTQQRFRHNVLIKANDIVGGAKLHGRNVKLSDALDQAHMVVTQQFRDEVIVSKLKKEAVKRHRAISVKPSKSKAKRKGTSDDTGVPGQRTREQAERALSQKLKKVFG